MLTSQALHDLIAGEPSCELVELAEQCMDRGFQPISKTAKQLEIAKQLDLTSSQNSTSSQNCELVESRINTGYSANKQTSQGGVQSHTERPEQSEALQLAKQAIARAALTDEQKQSRLADLAREPSIAAFWSQIFRDDAKQEMEKPE